MERPLVLGVDGGQTSTAALLATPAGVIVGVGMGGPANHIHEPGGIDRMRHSLRQAVEGAFASAGFPPGPVRSACFGMTGGMEAVAALVGDIVSCERLRVEHDVVTALAGAGGGQLGVVVIAGSGAIAYGRNVAGQTARASGWGYLAGDEGSAYDIGVRTIRAACRAADGRDPATVLLPMLLNHFAVADLWALHTGLYSNRYSRTDLADVAQLTSKAASAGDAVALAILRDAGEELALAALAVLTQLDLLARGAPVYTCGGVFKAGDPVLVPFREAIGQRSPLSRVQSPLFSQVVGALLLALDLYGVVLEPEVFNAIRASLTSVRDVKES